MTLPTTLLHTIQSPEDLRCRSSPASRPKAKSNAPSYTKVFGESLVKEATKDPRIVAITAAMPSGTGV